MLSKITKIITFVIAFVVGLFVARKVKADIKAGGTEFLIYDKDHWMDALTSEQIDTHKEHQADNYVKWRNTKIALTSKQIDDILHPLKQKAKEDWMAKHTEVLDMTQEDIDIKREKARVKFQTKYDARYQRGDIVEVRPDGFYTKTLKGDLSKWAFRVVAVKGLKPDKIYMEGTETRKRRFNVLTGARQKITMIALKDLNITDKNG